MDRPRSRLHTRLNISPHQHTGRLLPHAHTSYGGLAVLLVLLGTLLSGISLSAWAADPPPQSGYIGLSGQVPTPPPKTAAVIRSPGNGQHFSATPITVSGTCPAGTIVELYKNDIFAGSGPCQDNQTFSFQIDLLYGSNTLVARVFDALDQQGPDSNQVTVFYDALPPQTDATTSLSFTANQLLLSTSAVYRGVFPNQPLALPLTVLGGTPPFAVNVIWGDGTNSLVTRNDNTSFAVPHTYKKAGTFPVTIQATDAQGRVAFLTITVIVNGRADFVTGSTSTPPKSSPQVQILVIWPLYAILIALVVGFWSGERRERHVLHTQGFI